MRTLILTMVAVCLLTAGCGSDTATGVGIGTGIGALFQNTITGAKADLAAREKALVAAYNEGVAIGMKTEDLAAIEKELEWIRKGQAGAETGESLLGVDWNDPKQTGSAIANIIGLGLLIFGGKKLNKTTKKLKGTEAGIAKFCGMNSPEVAGQLHDTVKIKVLTNNV